MKNWYKTREGATLQHKSQAITKGKRIFLTEAQAEVHGDAIEKAEAPSSAEESAIKSEYDEWCASSLRADVPSKSEPIENQADKSQGEAQTAAKAAGDASASRKAK